MSTQQGGDEGGWTEDSSSVIHQVLHGYEHGHRLRAASCELPDEDLRVIDRLSDASGQRAVAGNDGYLTGYPLPSGTGYALACTWYATEATRPNVVWTHTLLLPAEVLGAPRLDVLIGHLRRPETGRGIELVKYEQALTVHPPVAPTMPEVVDGTWLRGLLAGLYHPGSELDPVVSAGGPVELRNAVCLAVWNQQWPRLRRQFAFCAGALEPRRLPERPFDLLLAPPDNSFPATAPAAAGALDPTIVEALARDVIAAGPLRGFLRVCGPDSARRRIMPLLVGAFLDATRSAAPDVVLERVTGQAPKPSSMRRLKRTLLHPNTGLLRDAEPTAIVDALLSPAVGPHVLAADAHLAAWASRAWDVHPQISLNQWMAARTIAAAPALGRGATVAQTAAGDLAELLAERAVPEHLASIASNDLQLAVRLLDQHHDAEWWSAWAKLSEAAFRGLLTAGVPAPDRRALDPAVESLLHSAGSARWTAVRDRVGTPAVRSLLHALGGYEAADAKAWVQLLREVPDQLAEVLDAGVSADEVAIAADAVPDAAFAIAVGFQTWSALAKHKRLLSGSSYRAAVVLAAGLSESSLRADEAVASVFPRLYAVFAEEEALSAWQLLAPVLPDRRHDWDRCQRLARGVAHSVRGVSGEPRPAILAKIAVGPARTALEAELAVLAEEQHKGRDRGNHTGKGAESNPFDSFFRLIRPW